MLPLLERKSVDLLSHPRTNTNLATAAPELDEDNTGSFTEGFKALGDSHRLKILYLLLTCGEMCVCETMLALEVSQSNLSFHLKALKQAGFIKARKSGRWMYYSLNRLAFEQFLQAFGGAFDLEKWPDKSQCTACEDARGSGNANG